MGDCRNDAVTGNQSKTLVGVKVEWVDAPPGEDIDITVAGVTQTINLPLNGCESYTQFILDADGSSGNVTATFDGGGCSAAPAPYQLPDACPGADPCGDPGTIGGNIFADFDSNGEIGASEFGLQGITVNA